MTITLGRYGAKDATGWTDFGTAPGSILYVSNTLNPGSTNVGTLANPFLTLSAAITQVNAIGDAGTWVLLRRGDQFLNESFFATWPTISIGANGVSGSFNGTWWGDSTTYSGQPLLISCFDEDFPVGTYGPNPIGSTRPRPLVTPQGNISALEAINANGNNFSIYGIEIYFSIHDPDNTSGSITPLYDTAFDNMNGSCIELKPSTTTLNWCHIEDCKLTFGGNGGIIDINGNNSVNPRGGNVTIRRCIIGNCWNLSASSCTGVGVIEGMNNIVIEENVFDFCGWNDLTTYDPNGSPDDADKIFHHSIYLQGGCYPEIVVRGNIMARDASGSDVRAPCQHYDNLYVKMGYGPGIANLGISPSYVANHYDNVYTEMGGTNAALSFQRLQVTVEYNSDLYYYGTTHVYRNIFCHFEHSETSVVTSYCSGRNVTFDADNIFYNVQSGANIYAVVDGSSYLSWSFNSIPDHLGGLFTITVTNGGVGGTPGAYTNVALLTSGSGQLGIGNFTVSGGGTVTAVVPYRPIPSPGAGYAQYGGYSFALNDTLSVASLASIGNVSTFTARVDAITGNTLNGTPTDIYPATGSYPHPERTLTTYAASIGVSPATTAGFITAARGQTKQTWNTNLTANLGANPYFRVGFGLDSEEGGGSVVLMGQACL